MLVISINRVPCGLSTHFPESTPAQTYLKQLNLVAIHEGALKCFRNNVKNGHQNSVLWITTDGWESVRSLSTTIPRMIHASCCWPQPDAGPPLDDESYQEANAGRRWTDELLDRFGAESWCLTLDIDEFLLFPFCRAIDLPTFCRYLEAQRYDGLFAVMLDFYPLATSQTRRTP